VARMAHSPPILTVWFRLRIARAFCYCRPTAARGEFCTRRRHQGAKHPQQERFGQQVSRWLAAASVACALAAATAIPQSAQAREIVGFSGSYSAGTVVVHTTEKSLYYVLGGGKALRYPVGVARAGRLWSDSTFITDKALRPTWVPPDVVRRDKSPVPQGSR
jgi:lipoprotein-anchoring transpeptidase ErfK/SrfK